jgi:hypothetical protein
MKASEAYNIILQAMNGAIIAKRIAKKAKRYRWFRVPEYEEFLIQDIKFCYLYARHVVHGRLPEKMHNLMIAEALVQSNSHYLKAYFEICKDNFSYSQDLINKENFERLEDNWRKVHSRYSPSTYPPAKLSKKAV